MLVAVTGNFGSGKSTVLQMFQELGAVTLSADDLVRQLLVRPDVREQIKKAFGEGVFKGGFVDRQKLAGMVFSSDSARKTLEAMLHPRVYEAIMSKARAYADSIVVAEVPLLFESGMQKDFDYVILVRCSRDKALHRLSNRGFSPEDARKRLAAQVPEELIRRHVDIIIDNSGSMDETRNQVIAAWKQLQARVKIGHSVGR